jgi:lysozyme
MTITADQAEQLLADDLRLYEKVVSNLVQVPLNDNQFAALVSFVFNVGQRGFETSTLLKLLNRGWYEQVPAQLTRWNRVQGEVLGGLSRRRAAEAALWKSTIGLGEGAA